MNKRLAAILVGRTLWGQVRRNHPDYVVFYVTRQCNCDCGFCFNKEDRALRQKDPELSLEEITSIARSLKPLHLVISGGEPFLRDDLKEIVAAFVQHAKTAFVAIPTNGLLTARIITAVAWLCDRFPDFQLDLNLSLDGIGENHDRSRGVKGAFEQLLITAAQLQPLRTRYANLAVNVLTVITRDNAPQLEELRRFVSETIKPGFHDVGVERNLFWEAADRDWALEQLAKIERTMPVPGRISVFGSIFKVFSALQSELIRNVSTERRMVFPCLGGRKLAVVDAEGQVYPCETLWFNKSRFTARRDYRIGSFRVANYQWQRIRRTDHYRHVTDLIHRRFCYCTWECALFNSLQYNPCFMARRMVRLIGKR